MDVNEYFHGELEKDNMVNQESMERFVEGIRGEIKSGLMLEDMNDPPLTLYIVTVCSECDDLHLVGSKVMVEGEDGEEVMLDRMPPPEIMSMYCKGVGRAIVNQGLVPLAVAIVTSAYFYAAPVPPDYQNNDEMIEDDIYLSSVSKDGIDSIDRFRDGERPENTGEAAVVQSLSVDGHRCAGFVQLKRDSFGHVRPAPKMPGIDDNVDGTSTDGTVSGQALSAIIDLFNASREAMEAHVSGKPLPTDPEVDFRSYNGDNDDMLLM
jgi:hypothetical protein